MAEKKKILIIGGDSFIANFFLGRFKPKYDITLVSRVSTNAENEVIQQDLFSIDANLFKQQNVVINFAAIVHKGNAVDEDNYIKVNYNLPSMLGKIAKENGVSQFIQMSSIAVYGKKTVIDIDTPEMPVNIYGKSKLMADNELLSLQDSHFGATIIRPPMIYGGGNAPGNMMKIIRLAKKRVPLPFKNVDNKRDFINVHNLTCFIGNVIDNGITGKCLICDQESVSTSELVKIIGESINEKILQFSMPIFLISILKKVSPNIFDKLYSSLKIIPNHIIDSPKKTVSDGISEMIEYLKSEH